MKMVKIEWADSYGVSPTWEPLDNIKDVAHKCISIGFLAFDGDNVKVVVPHLSPENKDTGAELQGCGEMTIPVNSIISIVSIGERNDT